MNRQEGIKLRGAYCTPALPLTVEECTPEVEKITNFGMFCQFCKQNGEPMEIYTSHYLSDNGRTLCPVLRMHVCKVCGETGDNAHTSSYCPLLKQMENIALYGPEMVANMAALKKTPFSAAGRRKAKH